MIFSSTCCCPAGGLALSALRYAALNKGAAFPLPGLPSQALRASSPKVGALGSPLSFPFYTLRPAAAKRAVRRCAQTSRLCQGLSLWERWHREAMTERASPAEAAQSLGLDRASDGAALPQRSAFVSQLLTFFSHTYSSTFLQILNVEVFLWNRKSAASP